MIVCSCNVFSDTDVRECVLKSPVAPKVAREVYSRLGCAPQCGRCARTIDGILREIAEDNGVTETVAVDEQAAA